jgi:uncharacterized glyoxalase superfamily protein PhnB
MPNRVVLFFDGQVKMPLAGKFRSPRSGKLADGLGIGWMIGAKT